MGLWAACGSVVSALAGKASCNDGIRTQRAWVRSNAFKWHRQATNVLLLASPSPPAMVARPTKEK
eukprot:3185627-Amphidinium_carterae.1